jgi:hypothetical protein
MRLRKTSIAFLIYLVPAMTVLMAYSAYHETLFKKPACTANCESTPSPAQRDIRKTLDLLDELARHKADLVKSSRSLVDLDFSYLQERLNALASESGLITRYGNGNLHHRWARLNAELNAKISDYLNSSLINDYFSNSLDALTGAMLPSKGTTLSRTNLADSILGNSSSLIGQALASDVLPSPNNYFVNPSNLRGGGGAGSNPNNPTLPSNPVSAVPLPGGVYLMMSALFVLAAFRYKQSH